MIAAIINTAAPGLLGVASERCGMGRRVVITGLGLVSPLGCNVELAWQRLLAGQSGVRVLDPAISAGTGAAVAGRVPTLAEDPEAGWNPEATIPAKELRRLDRFGAFALGASDQALAQAQWLEPTPEQNERAATIIGSGVGGFGTIVDAVRTTDGKGPQRLSPFTVPAFLANLAAGQVSIRHGLQGPIGAPVTACAASIQAIGDAARLIRNDEADMALCGGSEATIDRVALGSFAAAKALSNSGADNPAAASRPFDAGRDGFVMAEGAGLLVLESLEQALARGATPLAEVVGYGTSGDAYHVTSGPEDGSGAARSMQAALRQAKLQPSDIQHLNAHATSTPVGDRGELAAIRKVFGTGQGPAITATKSALGHMLGAAGGAAAIFTVLALRDQVVPPLLNLDTPDPLAEGLDLVTGQARPQAIEHAMLNGFGFGGVNATLILKRFAH